MALLLLGATAAPAASPAAAEAPYTFTQDGSRYTFVFSFVVAAEPDEVLDAVYPFADLQRFSRRASSVELLDEGDGWQTVRFSYATWLSRMSTTFRRELDRPGRRIRFRMLEARRTGLPMPLPTASSGEYRLDSVAHGVRVTYRQTAETRDTILLRPWMARARSEAILFSRDLETYVRSKLE